MPPQTLKVRKVDSVDCLDFSGKTVYNDFRDDLVRDGYAVVKGAIPEGRAAKYVDEIHSYLEGFGLGYDRNDPSTIRDECLPVISEKGMIQGYGVSHEQTLWSVRTEPGVRGAFEKVYDTEDLIVSFDVMNISFPNRKDLAPNKPWAHQDQDPDTTGFRCLQGLVNLLPCGDNDGGLIIMPGAHLISDEFHKEFKNEERIWQWTNEWYGFTENGLAWLRSKGYEFIKVNAGPGDLIIWDSRAPHYNCSPTGDRARMCVYTCYAPAWTATQEDLIKKKEAFETYVGSSHWPQNLQNFNRPIMRKDGTVCPISLTRKSPFNPPKLSAKDLGLTGIPYIASASS